MDHRVVRFLLKFKQTFSSTRQTEHPTQPVPGGTRRLECPYPDAALERSIWDVNTSGGEIVSVPRQLQVANTVLKKRNVQHVTLLNAALF